MINFWNGNKSAARQTYELALLQSILNTQYLSPVHLNNDITNYAKAEDEGNVFATGTDTDILTTISGNKKFNDKSFIALNKPICKGLLGYRILIIRQQDDKKFKQINETQLKALVAGIPATWVDADLFRSNQYSVLEKGSLSDILQLLKDEKCDYISLGANEIQSLFTQFAVPLEGLIIESSLVLRYPFSVVFYVHVDNKKLAQEVNKDLLHVTESGIFDRLFDHHYADVINKLGIPNRRIINLNNPELARSLDNKL